MNPQSLTVAFIAPVMILVLLVGIYLSNVHPGYLDYYLKEDYYLEWWAFLTLASTSLMTMIVGHQRRIKYNEPFWSVATAGTLLVALVFFFGAGEEVSWLQRIRGVESGELFRVHNKQAETNLHNMVINGVSINKLVFGKLLTLAIVIHNIVLPIMALKNKKWQNLVERFGLFLPSPKLVAIYLIVVIGVSLRLVEHERFREIMELGGALHYSAAIFMAYVLGVFNSKPLVTDRHGQTTAVYLFIGMTLFNAFIALVLAGFKHNLAV